MVFGERVRVIKVVLESTRGGIYYCPFDTFYGSNFAYEAFAFVRLIFLAFFSYTEVPIYW